MHIYVPWNKHIFGSNNCSLPVRHQATILISAGWLLIQPFGTNFEEIEIKLSIFHRRKLIQRLLNGRTIIPSLRCPSTEVDPVFIMYVTDRYKLPETIYDKFIDETLAVKPREFSWCQLCRHWWHRRLSLWQPAVTPWWQSWHHDHLWCLPWR